MAVKKTAPSNPYLAAADVEALDPAARAAHDILTDRGDLLPSVDRIMRAGLSEDDTAEALTLFRTALDQPGDRNRDPRVAIAAVGGGTVEVVS